MFQRTQHISAHHACLVAAEVQDTKHWQCHLHGIPPALAHGTTARQQREYPWEFAGAAQVAEQYFMRCSDGRHLRSSSLLQLSFVFFYEYTVFDNLAGASREISKT
jgi:hypothetical protein